jgi:hypothetical protein
MISCFAEGTFRCRDSYIGGSDFLGQEVSGWTRRDGRESIEVGGVAAYAPRLFSSGEYRVERGPAHVVGCRRFVDSVGALELA